MGFSGRLTPTQAQLGDANTPAAHLAKNQPATVNHDAGTNVRASDGANDFSAVPRNARRFVPRQYLRPAPGPATGRTPDAVAGGPLAAVHNQPGPADPDGRELFDSPVQAGNPGHMRPELSPIVEHFYAQPQGPNVVTTSAPPARARQGFTGADRTREGGHALWLYSRRFDQNMRRHFLGNKVINASPVASRPISHDAPITFPRPSAGGFGRAGQMNPVGIQPNTVRILPTPWDQRYVNTGNGDASAPVAAARARGWRAR